MTTITKMTALGLQTLVLASPLIASQAQAKDSVSADSFSREALAKASLRAIEASWANVPRVCKAAGFNAQPNKLAFDGLSQDAADIYSAFAV